MSIRNFAAASLMLAMTMCIANAEGPHLGTLLNEDAIPFYAGYVLPEGSGSVVEGAEIYYCDCSVCHGETGSEGPITPFVGPNETWDKPAGRH